jgi:hypothetical protein
MFSNHIYCFFDSDKYYENSDFRLKEREEERKKEKERKKETIERKNVYTKKKCTMGLGNGPKHLGGCSWII